MLGIFKSLNIHPNSTMIIGRHMEMNDFPFCLMADDINRQPIILSTFDHVKWSQVVDSTPKVMKKVDGLRSITSYGDWLSFLASQILKATNAWVSSFSFD